VRPTGFSGLDLRNCKNKCAWRAMARECSAFSRLHPWSLLPETGLARTTRFANALALQPKDLASHPVLLTFLPQSRS
jgi:hypothetical protein